MSMILGYIAVGIVTIIFIYVMGRAMISAMISAMIYLWKDDKKSFMVSVGLVLALVIAITGLILKGMGL